MQAMGVMVGKFQGFPGCGWFWGKKKGDEKLIQGKEPRIQWKSKALCVCVFLCGDNFSLMFERLLFALFFQKGLGYSTSIVCWCWNLNIQDI